MRYGGRQWLFNIISNPLTLGETPTNNSKVSKNLEKLSSGLNINRAADDAAGLVISEKMRGQIRGTMMGTQNVNMGINLIQTAEGGLNEVHAILQRMRELAVQSSNGTYDDEVDRKGLEQEYQSMMEEITRIAESTHYNGIKLIDGSNARAIASAATYQLNANQSSFSANSISTSALAATPLPSPLTTSIDINNLTNGMSGTGWSFSGNVLTITGDGSYQIDGTGATTANRIVVASGTVADVTLNNVNIQTSVGAALDMRGATVNLWLEGASNLRATNNNNAGIETTDGTLTIDGTGSIIAYSYNHAGIGGGGYDGNLPGGNGGTITINGGNVTASSVYGVGIGGGESSGSAGGDGAILTINGGNVTAVGRYAGGSMIGVGVGGGHGGGGYASGNGGTVTVNGGILTVDGSLGGGISQGSSCTAGAGADVLVTGGLLEVIGGWIGGGGEIGKGVGTVSGADGTTVITGGNLSVRASGTNVLGGVENDSGDAAFAVQIFLYDPDDGHQFKFDAHTEITYTLGSDTYSGITDSAGRLHMYLPAGSQGIQGTMTVGGTTYVGMLKTMNADNLDFLVFAEAGVDPPNPPEVPYPGYPDSPNPTDPTDPTDPTTPTGGLIIHYGANSNDELRIYINDMGSEALGVKDTHVDPWELANAAISHIDMAVNLVSLERSNLGAYQNRLESIARDNGVRTENLQAAESSIRDLDMAKEMMEFTKNNILTQAAQSMLAQANQLPQGVLSLLR